MIIDHRLYTLKPEKLEPWLAVWQKLALPLQREILGGFLGMYTTEVGANLSEVIHMWAYADMGEREHRRLKLAQDARWKAYLQTTRDLAPFVSTSSRLMRPTSFSPLLVPQYAAE